MKSKYPKEMINSKGNIVEFSSVRICQQEQIILQEVDFTIKPGEFVYLIGKVGSGKSRNNFV